MDQQKNNTGSASAFYERYSAYTDEEIMNILRNHKDYQENAVDAAVKIAVERKLIQSEQDLLSPGFQQVTPRHYTLFPPISNEFHRKKLIGSIFRFIYLLALVPVIYGFLSYAEGKFDRVAGAVGVAVLWAGLSYLFRKSGHAVLMVLLLIILSSVLAFSVTQVFGRTPLAVLDLLMAVTGTVLPAYLIVYAKQLLRNNRA